MTGELTVLISRRYTLGKWSAADETGEQHQRVPQLLIKIYLFGFVFAKLHNF
jgi:hypothetical protein